MNSLDLCSAAIFIGYESAWFGILSKSFASREGLLPHDEKVERFLLRFPLERALLLSLAMAVVGIIGLILALARWNAVGFGDLNTQSSLRVVVPSATLAVVEWPRRRCRACCCRSSRSHGHPAAPRRRRELDPAWTHGRGLAG